MEPKNVGLAAHPPGDFLPSLAQAMHEMAESRKPGSRDHLYVKHDHITGQFEASKGSKGACTAKVLKDIIEGVINKKDHLDRDPLAQKKRYTEDQLLEMQQRFRYFSEGLEVLEQEYRPSAYLFVRMISAVFRKIWGTDKTWNETKQVLRDMNNVMPKINNKLIVEHHVRSACTRYQSELDKVSPERQKLFATQVATVIETHLNSEKNISEDDLCNALSTTTIYEDLITDRLLQEELDRLAQANQEAFTSISTDSTKKEKFTKAVKICIRKKVRENKIGNAKIGIHYAPELIDSNSMHDDINNNETIRDMLLQEKPKGADDDDGGGNQPPAAGKKVAPAPVPPPLPTAHHLNSSLQLSSKPQGFEERAPERNGILLHSLRNGVKPDRESAITFLQSINDMNSHGPKKPIEQFARELLKTCMRDPNLVLPKSLFLNNQKWTFLGTLYVGIALELYNEQTKANIQSDTNPAVKLALTTSLMFYPKETILTLDEICAEVEIGLAKKAPAQANS